MTYYHAFIKYLDTNKKEQTLLNYNLSEQTLKREITNPFNEGRRFAPLGVILRPNDVIRIVVFKSEIDFQIILPSGKKTLDSNPETVVGYFYNELVEGVTTCTNDFVLISSERKEMDSKSEPTDKKLVFIGHGKEIKEALELQKFLRDNLEIDAKMFEDLKKESGCKTIIELLEYFRLNVGYAFIIFTPDDCGNLFEKIDELTTRLYRDKKMSKTELVDQICSMLPRRTRQNVVFELGLFIGAIGRDRVCYLLQKNVSDTPSNMDGVLYEPFDKSIGDTFVAIAEKLKKAGIV